jgi:drug/metabolite transporter (DMT)-like permease
VGSARHGVRRLGSTYFGIRVVVEDLPPLLAMGMRFVAAALVLAVVVAARRGIRALRVDVRSLGAAGLVGALLLLGGNGGVAVAEQTVPSGLAALLVSATPLWMVALRAGTGDRPRVKTVVGTTLGFAGIALLARPGSVEEDVQTWGILLILGATVCWAIGSFSSARLPLPRDPFVATVYEMLLGGAALLIVGAGRGEVGDLDPAAVSASSWVALGYLIVFGSIVAFSAYVWLLGNAPLSLVATYAYVNPVVAVALGALFLDESVTTAVVAGGVVVVAGVALVVNQERPRAKPRLAQPEPAPAR